MRYWLIPAIAITAMIGTIMLKTNDHRSCPPSPKSIVHLLSPVLVCPH